MINRQLENRICKCPHINPEGQYIDINENVTNIDALTDDGAVLKSEGPVIQIVKMKLSLT